ncbi:MAG: alginate lyase family protein [Aestuariivirga sp.]
MVVRLASLIFLALIAAAQAKPLLVDDARIATLRQNTKPARGLLRKCDSELTYSTHAVADFAPSPHYSAQGANPDGDQAKGLTGDFRRAYRMALCYRLNGDVSYAQAAQKIADAWAIAMKQASNAQGRADINFNVSQLVVAATWVEGANGWNGALFKSWLKSIVAPLSLSAEPNNRGNWGNLQDISIAAFIDDELALQQAAARWKALLSSEVAADGTMPLEICRSNSADHCGGPDKGVNGLAYTNYALLPAFLAAEILQGQGLDVYGSTGAAALQHAFSTSADFTANPTHFPFYVVNNGNLNKLDHCAHFALALTHFQNKNARSVLDAGTCKSDFWLLQKLF